MSDQGSDDKAGAEIGGINTLVAQYSLTGKAGAARTLTQMERRLGHPPLATLVLAEGEIGDGELDAKVKVFLSDLRQPEDR